MLRFAGADEPPALATLLPEPEEVEDLVIEQLTRSALFATHFRENAARALLLPRRRPERAHAAVGAAAEGADADGGGAALPQLPDRARDLPRVPARRVRPAGADGGSWRRSAAARCAWSRSTPASASPFARSLAFAYVAAYMYEGDAPLAERRAQALTLDRDLLRELLGQDELAALLDPAALDEVEAELQATDPERRARHADAAHDLLRRIGDLTAAELAARAERRRATWRAWLRALAETHQAAPVRVAGEERWIAAEDVGALPRRAGRAAARRHAAGAAGARAERRWSRWWRAGRARTGRSRPTRLAARFGLAPRQVEPVAEGAGGGRAPGRGAVPAGRRAPEWCDAEVMRVIRRRTLARLRTEVAPVEAAVLARFLPRWHGVGLARGGTARLREVIEQLEGAYLPFSDLERAILPARVRDFSPAMLDELGALGELVWIGGGALGGDDGRVALFRRDRVRALLRGARRCPTTLAERPRALLAALRSAGRQLLRAAVGGAARARPRARSWTRCGIWCGWAWSPTTPSSRCARCRRRGACAARAQPGRAGGRALVAGGVAAAPAGRRHGDRARARAGAARTLRRGQPRGRRRRGRCPAASRRCRRCFARWRTRARSAAATSSRG